MSVDYQEWHPCAALSEVVLAYWRVVGNGALVPSPTILPDAYIEIVINVGDPVTLVGSAFSGSQPERCVVGLLQTAIEIRYGPQVGTIGIRLHAGRAASFLGVPARTLVNALYPLRSLSAALDERLLRVLQAHPGIESAAGRSALDAVLVEHLSEAQPHDALVARAVDRLLEADVPVTVAGLARDLGVSTRQLHRRFLQHVGTPPKHLEQLARFARAWRQATMGPPLTWADLALANGYADQAHLVREFRAFGAQPPAHLFTEEWYGTTTVARVDVRSVQDVLKPAAHIGRVKPEAQLPARRKR